VQKRPIILRNLLFPKKNQVAAESRREMINDRSLCLFEKELTPFRNFEMGLMSFQIAV